MASLSSFSAFFFGNIPATFFELFQFNEFFSYLQYLEIDGGLVFNYNAAFYDQTSDLDRELFINERDEMLYQQIEDQLFKLTTKSIFSYQLLFHVIVISIIKLYFYFDEEHHKR